MVNSITVEIPDIGSFDSVDVIDILIKEGDEIKKEDPLITVESDKASMDIPSPVDGTATKILTKVGDAVKQGSPIIEVNITKANKNDIKKEEKVSEKKEAPKKIAESVKIKDTEESDLNCDVAILGSGPGGYTAAFRAADLGQSVILIERYSTIGGVCLNVGCIPSKALLHTAKVITDAEDTGSHGVTFTKPEIDLEKLRDWKSNRVVKKLTMGLSQMAKQRGVQVIEGYGEFSSSNQISVKLVDGSQKTIGFKSAVIAAGSQSTKIPGMPEDDRIMDSTGALELKDIPKKLLVIGGGIIGLEMGTVYDAMGSDVSVVELTDGLIQGCDRDIVRPLHKRM